MAKVKSVTVTFEDGTTETIERPIIAPVPDNPPTPAPKVNNVGVNLAAVRYYSSKRVFNDLAKTISPWVACTDASDGWGKGTMPGIDPLTGVPRGRVSGGYLASVLDLKKGHRSGQYSFLNPTSGVTVDNLPFGVMKTKDEQRLLFRVRDSLAFPFLFSDTDALATFDEDFLAECSKFSTLRFMNWNRTNALTPSQAIFVNRVTPSWYTQAEREVAIEYQCQLCNILKKPFWYNVHHAADNATVRLVAEKIAEQLGPTLPVRVEFTNEAWNNQFAAHKYCLDRSPSGNAMEYHLRRTVEVGKIFKEVFGTRAQTVLGSFTFGEETLQYVIRRASISTLTLDEIDEVSIAPYFGHGVTPATKASLSLDGIFRDVQSDLDTVLDKVWSWYEYARSMDWTFSAYEAGQHLVVHPSEHGNGGLVNAYSAANRDERMVGLYTEFLQAWDEITDKSDICLFENCSLFDKFGNWGLQEYHNQPLSETPKMRAVLAHIEKP